MYKRLLEHKLRDVAAHYPIVTLTGPRQSGKTTLMRSTFPQAAYVSLELPQQRVRALEDPQGFLAQFDGPVILDEAQRAPELFSYLQVLVDEDSRPGRFLLTGSQNFLLLQSISQSLAGRSAILHLLPLSLAELEGRQSVEVRLLGDTHLQRRRVGTAPPELHTVLFQGLYPRIHDQGLDAREWLANYYQAYLERDARNVLQIGDLEMFNRFVRLCAGRNGQLLNGSALAADCGITHTTARRWLSVLEASFVIVLLQPHHRNFGKRLVKRPKLYFLDPGLVCMLLNVQTAEELHTHAARGALFETFVLAELYKNFLHRGESRPPLYFWRDATGHEVDILVDYGQQLVPIEIKSSHTLPSDAFRALQHWRTLTTQSDAPAALIYAGTDAYARHGVAVQPWCDL